jgi:DNA-binding FrmR family transcriptional regulator
MPDEARDDLNQRLKCVHGHLQATAQMIKRGEDDLAIVHQLHAVQGALTQIQIRLLRLWLSERPQPSDDVRQIKRDLSAILKRRRRHEYNSRH